MTIRPLAAMLVFCLIGCTATTAVRVPLPEPTSLPIERVELAEHGVAFLLVDGWTSVQQQEGFFLWQGPLRASGRAMLRLVVSNDSRQPLDDLAVSAVRVEGVDYPSDPEGYRIAGHAGRRSSGIIGVFDRKIMAIVWRGEDTTYLLVISWVDDRDSFALGTTVESMEVRPGS